MAKSIQAAVGPDATNIKTDVMTVQDLLNRVTLDKGGPAVPLKIDGIAGPKTIGAIRNFQHVALGHKWPDGRVDPKGKTLAALNEYDKPQPKPEWYSYVVPGHKPLIGQPFNSYVCWAASYTMLRSWRDGKTYAIEDALGKVGAKYVQMYKANQGLPPGETGPFLTKAGLRGHRMECYPPETWLSYLKSCGLLWVGALSMVAPVLQYHARIVEGTYGFAGTPESWLCMLDPGWNGKKYNEGMAEFTAKYELAMMTVPSDSFQLMHY